MQIKSKEKRVLILNVFISFIPEILVASIINYLSDGNFASFFLIFAGLYLVYFLIWLKQSVWEWVLFSLNRKKLSEVYADFFKDNNYPEPPSCLSSGTEWLLEVATNPDYEPKIRVSAAYEAGGFNALQQNGYIQKLLKCSILLEEGIEAYKKTFPIIKQEDSTQEPNLQEEFSEEDEEKFLKIVNAVQIKSRFAQVMAEEVLQSRQGGTLDGEQLKKR